MGFPIFLQTREFSQHYDYSLRFLNSSHSIINSTTNLTNYSSNATDSNTQETEKIKDFFKTSAFFIVFISLYFIIVPLVFKFKTNFQIMGIVKPLRNSHISSFWV